MPQPTFPRIPSHTGSACLKVLLLSWVLLTAPGCASNRAMDARDPLEGVNRNIHAFNEVTNEKLFNPLTRLYRAITPDFLDRAISNVFNNLGSIANIANNLLQLQINQAGAELARLAFNSSLGLGGLIDVGSHVNLEENPEDFGQTLAVWGVPAGPFIMVPFFGPATVRDISISIVDIALLSPISYLRNTPARAGLMGLEYIDFNSDLKAAKTLLAAAAVDEYEFTKNIYFEKRAQDLLE